MRCTITRWMAVLLFSLLLRAWPIVVLHSRGANKQTNASLSVMSLEDIGRERERERKSRLSNATWDLDREYREDISEGTFRGRGLFICSIIVEVVTRKKGLLLPHQTHLEDIAVNPPFKPEFMAQKWGKGARE